MKEPDLEILLVVAHEHDSPDDEQQLLAEDLSALEALEPPLLVRRKDVLDETNSDEEDEIAIAGNCHY